MLGLTKKTDYALLALTYLARSGNGDAVRTRKIAEVYDIPVELLAKVLQQLARSGILHSAPGPSGGYLLARPPAEITVGAVLEAVEGAPALAQCLRSEQKDCEQVRRCTIRGPLARINALVYRTLEAIPVSELVSDGNAVAISDIGATERPATAAGVARGAR